MYSIKECRVIVEDELLKLASEFPPRPERLFKPIEYILGIGGKRIRPILVLLANNLFDDKIDQALYPAIAVEVFHNFTLLHDDIMDNSSLRRGQKTVNELWDDNIAILSGDAMSILSYQLLNKSNPQKLPYILSEFNKMAMEVCEGQQYDMDFEEMDEVAESDYINMIRLKTAVLIAGSLKIGAICGNASEKDANLIYEFGINIGLAFQLQDDYLDIFGDQDEFGKRIGLDIIARKKNLLLIKAYELANLNQKELLHKTINSNSITDDEKVEIVRNLYLDLDLKQYTKDRMTQMYDKAMLSLESIDVEVNKKTELISLAHSLFNRNA